MRDAKQVLARMQGSLKSWLRYRDLNDKAGLTQADVADRAQHEHMLKARLLELLAQVHPGAQLPDDVRELGLIALGRMQPNALQAQGLWPIVIAAGAAVLVLGHAISSYADVAKERERLRCIEKVGAWQCDPVGQTVKYGIYFLAGYVIWNNLGVGAKVKKLIKKA